MKGSPRVLLLIATVALLVGCDHATKAGAQLALCDHPPTPVVRGLVDLVYTENHGVAFSLLERLCLCVPSAVLLACSLLVTGVVVALWVRRRAEGWPVHVGFAFIVAGALGNALDRFARGYVVDFIHVRFWPVFNVADVLVVVGGLTLLLARSRARALSA